MEQAANLISEAFISMGCFISKVRFKQVYYKNVLIWKSISTQLYS